MDRDKKPLTTQEKNEMDLMAEAELAKLQRQYRIMETDRKAFGEETSTALAKQKSIIKALQREKENLVADLKVATCISNKRKDNFVTAQMNKLLDEHDNHDETIQKRKAHLIEVDKQIKKIEKRVFGLRSTQITDAQFEAKVSSGNRILITLQNQLDTEIKRFCTTLSSNTKLREEIDHLLKERAHFNSIWEKLLNDLNHGKKLMLDLIEQATLAYDQREEWGSKLRALKIRNENDLMVHGQEMKELQRQMDQNLVLYDFMGVKGQKRVLKDLEKKEQRKKEKVKEDMEEQLMKYQKMLKEIQDLMDEEDISRLSMQYLKQEEENFALFNYVNELNHEIETISDSINQLRIEINDQREINEIKAKQQKHTVDTLTVDLEAAEKEENESQEKLYRTNQDLDRLLKGIEGLFNLLHCDDTPILQLLAENAPINNFNVMLYLGILEKKVGEVTSNIYLREKLAVAENQTKE